MNEVINYSKRRMRNRIGELPNGVFTFEDFMEGDGLSEDLLKIRVTLTIKVDRTMVDFMSTSQKARDR